MENKLKEPNAPLTVCGESVDLTSLTLPIFIYGSCGDHIVPWKSAYASAPILSGPQKFVLGTSGHIVRVINPPSKNKRSFWIMEGVDHFPADADDWFDAATEHPGSWWSTWSAWLAENAGEQVAAGKAQGSQALSGDRAGVGAMSCSATCEPQMRNSLIENGIGGRCQRKPK